jgi:hypothetical protein
MSLRLWVSPRMTPTVPTWFLRKGSSTFFSETGTEGTLRAHMLPSREAGLKVKCIQFAAESKGGLLKGETVIKDWTEPLAS